MARCSASERVVSCLLRDSVPRGGKQPCRVVLPSVTGTIVSWLSGTPEPFSRILHDLQSRGLIAVNRCEIHILDVHRLACRA